MFIGVKDQKKGLFRKFYIWFHNLINSPKNRITMEDNKGFVYGQTIKRKLINATPFAATIEFITFWIPDAMPLYVDLLLYVLLHFFIWIGFIFTPLAVTLVDSFKWGLDRSDDIQTGKINLKDEIQKAGDRAKQTIIEKSGDAGDAIKKSILTKKDSENKKQEFEDKNNAYPTQDKEPNDKYYIDKLESFGKGGKNEWHKQWHKQSRRGRERSNILVSKKYLFWYKKRSTKHMEK